MSDVPLKEYFENRLCELNKRFSERVDEINENVVKAEHQLNHRLEGMNEFRESLRDQSARFLTRAEYDYAHKAIDEKVRSMELARANFEGRVATIASLVSIAVSIMVGVVIFIFERYISK